MLPFTLLELEDFGAICQAREKEKGHGREFEFCIPAIIPIFHPSMILKLLSLKEKTNLLVYEGRKLLHYYKQPKFT